MYMKFLKNSDGDLLKRMNFISNMN